MDTEGRHVLKSDSWRDVRIWDWPLYTKEERETVAKLALKAFDAMGLPAEAKERLVLRPQQLQNASPAVKSQIPQQEAQDNSEIESGEIVMDIPSSSLRERVIHALAVRGLQYAEVYERVSLPGQPPVDQQQLKAMLDLVLWIFKTKYRWHGLIKHGYLRQICTVN